MAAERVDTSPLHGLWALTNRELKKWYKVPVLLLISLVQPILWLGLFGKAMNLGYLFTSSSISIPGLNVPSQLIDEFGQYVLKYTFGTTNYFSFLAAGMLSFIVLFMSMQSGMTIIWDRRLGVLDKLLVTPVSRASIVMGKALSSVIKSLVQATVVLLVATLLGLQYRAGVGPLDFLGTYAALFMLSLGMSSLFLLLAIRSSSWETQMMIMNLVNMPLMFSSNSFYPVKMMPWWLKPVAEANPISYANDIARQLLIGAAGTGSLAMDFAVLLAFAALTTALSLSLSLRYLSP